MLERQTSDVVQSATVHQEYASKIQLETTVMDNLVAAVCKSIVEGTIPSASSGCYQEDVVLKWRGIHVSTIECYVHSQPLFGTDLQSCT